MKTVKIIPSVCKGESALWSGHVVMRSLSFDEKFEMIEESNINISKDPEAAVDKMANIKIMRKLVKLSEKFYVEVELSKKDGSQAAKSFDDMQYIDELHPVLTELATEMLEGFKVGNA